VIAAALLAGCAIRQPTPTVRNPTIQNPYAGVDWAEHGRYKASLHTHTLASDGNMYPHEVIDEYQRLGYDVLAITDHNRVSYPWTELSYLYGEKFEDRDPETVGIFDVPGNELSRHNHIGSYWTMHRGLFKKSESLEATAALDGQTMLSHPGRYDKTARTYARLFRRFDHLTGMEVYNQGDRYPNDRKKWDAVLTKLMPDRPAWGFSNDDMHRRSHIGRNWNILLLPELTEEWVRRSLDTGRFFFVYAPLGHDGPPPPLIRSVTVDQETATIRVQVSGHARLEWISDGVVVHASEQLNVTEVPGIGSYVRLMVYGAEGDAVVGTQPFGIRRPAWWSVGVATANSWMKKMLELFPFDL
jgi:hypothetical protein